MTSGSTSPKLGKADLHDLAALTFTGRLRLRQTLRLIGRTDGAKACFCKLICQMGPLEGRFANRLFGLAQVEIARGEVSIDLGAGGVMTNCFVLQFEGGMTAMVCESGLHGLFQQQVLC